MWFLMISRSSCRGRGGSLDALQVLFELANYVVRDRGALAEMEVCQNRKPARLGISFAYRSSAERCRPRLHCRGAPEGVVVARGAVGRARPWHTEGRSYPPHSLLWAPQGPASWAARCIRVLRCTARRRVSSRTLGRASGAAAEPRMRKAYRAPCPSAFSRRLG